MFDAIRFKFFECIFSSFSLSTRYLTSFHFVFLLASWIFWTRQKYHLIALIKYSHNILENSSTKVMKYLLQPKDNTSKRTQMYEWTIFITSIYLIGQLLMNYDIACFPTKYIVKELSWVVILGMLSTKFFD